jgi:hypothetical protein
MYILSLPFLFSRAELTKGIVYVSCSSSARTLKKSLHGSFIKIKMAEFSKTLERVYPREEKKYWTNQEDDPKNL